MRKQWCFHFRHSYFRLEHFRIEETLLEKTLGLVLVVVVSAVVPIGVGWAID
ncbi:hypothetical protein I6J22_05695 [Corynebacterium kroppenstedtii]|uniref:hypothetical protein n=1 Tax=Corynebacterium kroppenstedtii TaxID=161879 RepID=UPI00031A8C6F|nr:hypothetical protein [Corynebacterium kroppenstedtii]QRP09765.1 hypothetical protein I6J22_05695 [Corynebacterium kroppenstedtii]